MWIGRCSRFQFPIYFLSLHSLFLSSPYYHPFVVTHILLFFLCLLLSLMPDAPCVPLSRFLCQKCQFSVLSEARPHIIPTTHSAKTFKAHKKQNFHLSLLKTPCSQAAGLMKPGSLWLCIWLARCHNLVSYVSFMSCVTSLLRGRRDQGSEHTAQHSCQQLHSFPISLLEIEFESLVLWLYET